MLALSKYCIFAPAIERKRKVAVKTTIISDKMGDRITTIEQGMQRRTELLLGKDNLEKLQSARVLIFGCLLYTSEAADD